VLAGVRQLVGDRTVVNRDAVAWAAEEAPSVVYLQQVGDYVDRYQRDGDQRKPRERDVVFEREYRASLPATADESCRRASLADSRRQITENSN
jgi:hypothetical protein